MFFADCDHVGVLAFVKPVSLRVCGLAEGALGEVSVFLEGRARLSGVSIVPAFVVYNACVGGGCGKLCFC